MIFHGYYTNIPPEEVDRFVRSREMGRLVTVDGAGAPHIGLYPFVYADDAIEIHLVRQDEQMSDLRARPRCLFEVDEVLGVIPSYWVHPESAVVATVSDDAAILAEQQMRLLARYQPEGGFRPVTADDPLYRGALAHIAAVRLAVTARRAKFKLGQNRPPDARGKIVEELRKRGRPNDGRAADALAWTIEQETRP